MTRVTASAPGKVIVCGEYAVLDGAPAICMAVDRRARVSIVAVDASRHTVSAPGYLAKPRSFASIEESANVLPLLAAVWRRMPISQKGYFDIELDSRSFRAAAGTKLGVGSSAAIAVALTAALGRIASTSSNVGDVAAEAHRELQGGTGSGVDVACSVAGNVIQYRMQGRASQALTWPTGLHYALLWSGRSADTATQLEKLAGADAKASRAGLVEAATAVATAWQDEQVAGIITALRDYTDSLRRFDVDHRLGIFDAGHAELADAAASGEVVYKPCGAGAGDLGIAVANNESALAEFIAVASSRNFKPLDLTIDANGVEVEGSVN
ncbi:MAG: mevalonate kinase family protein [Woeseiaceae bacterium]